MKQEHELQAITPHSTVARELHGSLQNMLKSWHDDHTSQLERLCCALTALDAHKVSSKRRRDAQKGLTLSFVLQMIKKWQQFQAVVRVVAREMG
jgi:hypothetical protein